MSEIQAKMTLFSDSLNAYSGKHAECRSSILFGYNCLGDFYKY